MQNHITYRQVNCYELCYQKHLESLVALRNISFLEAFHNTSDFNRSDDCDHLCPLECNSISFEQSGKRILLNDDKFDYNLNEYLNNSSYYKKKNFVVILLQYSEMKQTHMSQTAKMTFTDLVSNIGGVMGVFLEISFFTAYRIIYFLLERLI